MTSVITASSLAEEVAKKTEISIMSQLNDFVSRDLIHLKMGPNVFVHENTSEGMKITLKQTCELVLKDKDYIEFLEEENKLLREKIRAKNEIK